MHNHKHPLIAAIKRTLADLGATRRILGRMRPEILALETDARLKGRAFGVLNQVGCSGRTVALLVDDDPVDFRLS